MKVNVPIRDPVPIDPKSKGNKRELTYCHSDCNRYHIWRRGTEDVSNKKDHQDQYHEGKPIFSRR